MRASSSPSPLPPDPGARGRRSTTARSARAGKWMKCSEYEALVTLLPPADGGPDVALSGPVFRAGVLARHHETHADRLFSALVTRDGFRPSAGSRIAVTLAILGADAGDCLAVGDQFILSRGHDVGRGVITRRVFV